MGIGFAVPSTMVLALLRNTQADGTVLRPWLGASYQDMTPDIAESLGVAKPAGALVAKVMEGGPAEKAGIKVGDVIVSMNGQAIGDIQELKFRVHTAKTDEKTVFGILRNGQRMEKEAYLQSPPEKPLRDMRTLKGNHPLSGLTVVNLSPRVAIELGLDAETEGVAVSGAAVRGIATQFGLQKGDIILRVNKTPITSTRQLESLMKDRAYGWNISFLRAGREMGLSVQR